MYSRIKNILKICTFYLENLFVGSKNYLNGFVSVSEFCLLSFPYKVTSLSSDIVVFGPDDPMLKMSLSYVS